MARKSYIIEEGLVVRGSVQADNFPLKTNSLLVSAPSVQPGEIVNLELPAGQNFHLLSVKSSSPAWIRVYGTQQGRDADLRTSPGEAGIPPEAGSEFYAELVTSFAGQKIRLSPTPLVQGRGGISFLKVRNELEVESPIDLEIQFITLEEYVEPEFSVVAAWKNCSSLTSIDFFVPD